MKKKCWFALIACFSIVSCMAQGNTEVLSQIPITGKTVKAFFPKGFHEVASASGDFNGDGKEDKVIVLEEDTPRYRKYAGYDRKLIILKRTKEGWVLAGKSEDMMVMADVNADPMIQMDMVGNTLEILQITYQKGTLTNFKNKFRYDNGYFLLTHRTVDSCTIQVKCEKLNEYRNKRYEDIDFETGKRVRKRISYYCELLEDKIDTLEVKPLIKLSEVKPE